MTVTELREICEQFEKDGLGETEVIKSQDEEGNGYNEVSSLELSMGKVEEREIHLVHPDDFDEYDELDQYICMW